MIIERGVPAFATIVSAPGSYSTMPVKAQVEITFSSVARKRDCHQAICNPSVSEINKSRMSLSELGIRLVALMQPSPG